jgi:predicted HD superfamily hydrolase involved in NAD metabolism
MARAVRAHLDQDHRYAHVVRVARCCDVLAQRHGVSPKKARIAGLLHDLARLYSAPRLIEECELRGIEIGAFERENPIVLHAPVGAALARERFGVTDPEILSAIEKHTLADSAMSPLDCIVFLADGLEPGRSFAERERLWSLAFDDLRAATAATIRNTIDYLHARGLHPAPQTEGALSSLN